ncbi:MAG: AzlC family ABC transporter permease [Lachnospiraceae bacterium]
MTQSNCNPTEFKKAFHAAFPKTIPVLTGFLLLGAAYGVLMQSKGYGILWAVLMSAFAFCGSMQFVALTFLTIAFHPLQAFLMSLMVNARHLFYGLAMLEKYKGLGKIRGFLIFTLCDESFSILCSVEPPVFINKKYFYFWVSFLDYLYWVFGTLLGGILGGFLSFDTRGLDFVLTALFIVLFAEQWHIAKNRKSCIIGIVCTLVSLLLFGPENFVLPAMIFILCTLMIGRKKLCN